MSLPDNIINFDNLQITDSEHPLCCKAMALATKLEQAFLNSDQEIDKEFIASRVSVLLCIEHYGEELTQGQIDMLKVLGSSDSFSNEVLYAILTYEFKMPYLLFWHEQREEYFIGNISE